MINLFHAVVMDSIKISWKQLVLFAMFSLSFINEASSRSCYVCESNTNGSCYANVFQNGFEFDCKEIMKGIPKNVDESSHHLYALIKAYSDDNLSGSATAFDCYTIIGKTIAEEKIVRACAPRMKNCDFLEAPLRSSGFLTESCHPCDGDLCNKSDRLNVGLWCVIGFLMSPLLAIYV